MAVLIGSDSTYTETERDSEAGCFGLAATEREG